MFIFIHIFNKFYILINYVRTGRKLNLKEDGGKLVSNSSPSVQKNLLKMLAFFVFKIGKIIQMFVKGLFIEARPRVLRDFHNSFGLPILIFFS